jgi:hypothetical protein
LLIFVDTDRRLVISVDDGFGGFGPTAPAPFVAPAPVPNLIPASAAIDPVVKQLQRSWWNWDLCTNADRNTSFTPTNSLVPNNTIFLTTYPTYLYAPPNLCREQTFDRRGTINVGRQTVFFPLANAAFFDYTDDWKLGRLGCATSPAEAESQRQQRGRLQDAAFTTSDTIRGLYLYIDGVNATAPFYIYDTDEFYMSSCEDNRTTQSYAILTGVGGDTCDDPIYQAIGGLDSYPMLGWYGLDTREWADGETHI